jgi:hypothetical protein
MSARNKLRVVDIEINLKNICLSSISMKAASILKNVGEKTIDIRPSA